MTATTFTARPRPRLLGLTDPATYRRTLHLLLDLPIGVATFSVAVALVSTSVSLAITLIGLPLLAITLLAGRGMGQLERARARALLDVHVPEPDAAPRGWRRLTDTTGWRSIGYAVVMLPIGVMTSTVAATGWSVAASMFAYPAYAPFLDDSSVTVGSVTFGGWGAQLVTSLIGLALLLMMPSIVRGLARIDAAAVRRLLH